MKTLKLVNLTNRNQDLLLLLLSVCPESWTGVVKIITPIFLLQTANPKSFNYHYHRWDFGPFDPTIHQDLRALETWGLVKADYNLFEKVFTLTCKGKNQVAELRPRFKELLSQIQRISQKIDSLDYLQARNYLYKLAKISEYEMGDTIRLPSLLDLV